MLKEFVYLDENLIRQFVSQLDGGLLQRRTDSASRGKRRSGRFKAAGVSLEATGQNTESAEREYVDNIYSAFDRLVAVAHDRPDDLGWVEVMDPDRELPVINKGMIVEGEAEFTVPQVVRFLANRGALNDLAFAAEQMSALPESIFQPKRNLEALEKLQQFSALAAAFEGQSSVIGEFAESIWSLGGTLDQEIHLDDLEGPLRFVGKVTDVLPEGKWKSLFTLPGQTLLSRSQRRTLETEPKENQEENWLRGPALILKFIAIYR